MLRPVTSLTRDTASIHRFATLQPLLRAHVPLHCLHHSRRDFLHVPLPPSLQRNVRAMAAIRESLSMLGFRSDQLDNVFRILAAIIHLGDVAFTSSDDEESNTEKVVVQAKDKLRDGEDRGSKRVLQRGNFSCEMLHICISRTDAFALSVCFNFFVLIRKDPYNVNWKCSSS